MLRRRENPYRIVAKAGPQVSNLDLSPRKWKRCHPHPRKPSKQRRFPSYRIGDKKGQKNTSELTATCLFTSIGLRRSSRKNDVFLFIVRHQKGSEGPPRRHFHEIAKAEFFFGESWGNQVFTVSNSGDVIKSSNQRMGNVFGMLPNNVQGRKSRADHSVQIHRFSHAPRLSEQRLIDAVGVAAGEEKGGRRTGQNINSKRMFGAAPVSSFIQTSLKFAPSFPTSASHHLQHRPALLRFTASNTVPMSHFPPPKTQSPAIPMAN